MRLFRQLNISATCFAIGALTLGYAIQVSNGFYHPTALGFLTAAFVVVLAGVAMYRFSEGLTALDRRVLHTLLGLGIAFQFVVLLSNQTPLLFLTAESNLLPFRLLVATQAMAVAIGLSGWKRLRAAWFPLCLAASLALGVWTIRTSPNPFIDVFTVHKEAIDALLKGGDPYRISFPNLYPPEMARVFYNPEALIGNRVAFGYPYPPASLLLVVPGQLLLNDYRYAELALLVGAAALIGWSRRGLVAKLAACLLLTTPRVWFVIEQGWTEPVGIFLLALTVFLLIRQSIPAGAAAGLMVVTKQYLGFAGLAVIRLAFYRPQRWLWTAVAGVGAAALITLPMALDHPNAFVRNVVWLQTLEPFRMDSLSFVSWAARAGFGRGSYLWAVGAALIAAVASLLLTRNSVSGFAAAVAVTTFSMFVFGSKAFCNYYFFVIGALCTTVAAYAAPAPAGNDGPDTATPLPTT